MRIEITGRQVEIAPALRKFAAEKLRKLERLLDGPVQVHVVLAMEKHRHRAEILVKSRTASLSGVAETDDLRLALAEAVEKLERRAVRRKEKLAAKKRRGRRRSGAPPAPEGSANPAGDGRPGARRLLPSERYRLKPLSPEDAVLELEGTGEDLLVFRNAETARLNVVYRRSDGHYGLVDPDF